jgi:hypothetical protein
MKVCAALLVAAAFTSTASFAGDADFTLVNKTGYDIREVYVSAANRNNWGNDRMGSNMLENNKSRLFKFSDRASCMQDMKVVFDDGDQEVTWPGIDLCEVEKLTLKYNRSTKEVSALKE